MRGIDQSWESQSDAAEREARAQDQLDTALDLVNHPGWQAVASAISDQLSDTINDLARSQKDDEQNRGVIRALNHVLMMPENLIRAASSELDTHR